MIMQRMVSIVEDARLMKYSQLMVVMIIKIKILQSDKNSFINQV